MPLSHQIELDKTGFPMIWIQEVKKYLHLIPVTKIQFEIFMCDTPHPKFDGEWYIGKILNLNPRVSPNAIEGNNYWGVFMTGIKPDEIVSFIRWCDTDGNKYVIPDVDLWNEIFNIVKKKPPIDNLESIRGLSDRSRVIMGRLDKVNRQKAESINRKYTLADQMIMRYGVMEWVTNLSQVQEWAGLGEPHPEFHPVLKSVDDGVPELPKDPYTDRLDYYGFRLLRT